jgi:membrane associated rhomboid family serine protease
MLLPPKLWFKLERLKIWWRSSLGSKNQSYDTSHRMCPECRALISRGAKACPHCGAKTGPLRARGSANADPGRIMGIIPAPTSVTSVLVAANIVMFAVEWYLTQKAGGPGGATGLFGGIRGDVMLRLGGKFGPLIYAGQWWRLVTAMFLHAGLLHIGFNLWCLFDLGPEVESLFSAPKYIVLYLATGAIGFMVSLWLNPLVLSIGASGAILGLIGVLIGASFHHGHLGKEYRSQLWRWVIYIFIFGLFFNIDNAAHLGGLVSGFMLGYLVPEGQPETRPSESLWNSLALLSIVVIAGSFALMALQINRPLIF